MNLQCHAPQDVTPNSATLIGTGDWIPTNHFLRIAWSESPGGPYTSLGPLYNGIYSSQQYAQAFANGFSPATTIYYVVQEIDSDGTSLLDESDECSFETDTFAVTCEIVGSAPGSITVRVCADNVGPDQNLQVSYGSTPGGPYPNTVVGAAGTSTVNQCDDIIVPLAGNCDAIYLVGQVAPLPATYELDWSYAHRASNFNGEHVELRIGPEQDYPANQTLVDSDIANLADGWHHQSGTYVLPPGVDTVHMGFVGIFPTGGVGNHIDSCSIVLRRVTPDPLNLGEQLINGSFEVPAFSNPAGFVQIPETTPGLAWQTTDSSGKIELWHAPVTGHPGWASDTGVQDAELNAFEDAELFQVVSLAILTADSEECSYVAINTETTAVNNIDCTSATLEGTVCGLPEGYSYAFQWATSAAGPWIYQSPLTPWIGPVSNVPVPVSYNVTGLEENKEYFYRLIVVGPDQTIVHTTVLPGSFTTSDCAVWCGGLHDPQDCVLVTPSFGNPYFNCNQV